MGLMFIIYGGVYAITAPGIGWICDKLFPPLYLMLAGAFCIFGAFILIGPAPFLKMET
jgi:drug/metabolite transporter superfamily protein YnfA